MKKTILVSMVLLIFITILPAGYAFSDTIHWQPYPKGIAMAKAENKKIFLYFHTSWCHYCKKMKTSTFKNPDVIKYLNKHFISITIDAEKEKKIARAYGVRGFPTLWFLKHDSSKLSKIPGYVEAKTLINVLKYIETGSYMKMSFNDFLKTI